MILRLLFVLLLAAPSALACSIESAAFIPMHPRANDPVTLQLGGRCPTSCTPMAPVITREGSTIRLHFPQYPPNIGCLTVITPFSRGVDLGGLSAGTYTIRVTGQIEATYTLTVENAAPFTITPRSGRGLTEVLLEMPNVAQCDATPCPTPVVRFGGVETIVRVLDANRLAVTVPPHAPGVVDVTVTTARGTTVTLAGAFRYFDFDPIETTRVLFPITLSGPGAFGSEWETRNVIRNDAPITIAIDEARRIPAGARMRLEPHNREGGLVLRVHHQLLQHVSFASHVRDLSRSATDLGTEMRVITDADAASHLDILDVPNDPRYRATLRIYDLDSIDGRTVRVTIRPADGSGPPVSETVTLRTLTRCAVAPCVIPEAAFAVVNLRGVSAMYDVEVSSDDRAPLWAFVSVTNNDTQHVTTYTPQR